MDTNKLEGRRAELRARLGRYLDHLDAALERGEPALAAAYAQAAQAASVALAPAAAGDHETGGNLWSITPEVRPRYRNMSAEDGEPR